MENITAETTETVNICIYCWKDEVSCSVLLLRDEAAKLHEELGAKLGCHECSCFEKGVDHARATVSDWHEGGGGGYGFGL